MNHTYPVIQRGGVLLSPDKNDPREAEGILNPAVAGDYLLYRAVGKGNFSRIMVATLTDKRISEDEIVVSAKKMNQVALEPTEIYEMIDAEHGGVEDPRVTQFSDGQYIMMYCGYGQPKELSIQTPVVGLATSQDGLHWDKKGRVLFQPYLYDEITLDFNTLPNKDAVLFGEKINGRYAMLHRPTLTPELCAATKLPPRCIWYAESDSLVGPWETKSVLLRPEFPWESSGIGAGAPPVHLKDAWVHVYHGLTEHEQHKDYSAGIFISPHNDPKQVLYRSQCALLSPNQAEEQQGTKPDVIFPTALWPLTDDTNSLALFWGGADSHILWGQLHLPTDVMPLGDL